MVESLSLQLLACPCVFQPTAALTPGHARLLYNQFFWNFQLRNSQAIQIYVSDRIGIRRYGEELLA